MDLSFILNELGEGHEENAGAVAPSIVPSVNFAFKTVAEMRQAFKDEYQIPLYSRGNNPTVDLLNKKVAALEQTEAALSFASGSAAVAAAVMANVAQGDHIVFIKNPYNWTNRLMNQLLPRFGVETTAVDGTDPENYRKAIRHNTKLLYLESPNTFTFELQDIEAVVNIAREHELLTIMDNSYATPINCKPSTFGVDLVVHAATKYLNGHSDALAGIVCGSEAMMRKIFYSEFMTLGATLSPFNAWLLLRGLRTLPLRMQRVSQTTAVLTQRLENHPKVAKVHYPFLPSHPQYELAKRQIAKGAGLFSIELKTADVKKVEMFSNQLQHFSLAASWGGYESLVWPYCAVYIPEGVTPAYPPNLIRFYAGLEDVDMLWGDLEAALSLI